MILHVLYNTYVYYSLLLLELSLPSMLTFKIYVHEPVYHILLARFRLCELSLRKTEKLNLLLSHFTAKKNVSFFQKIVNLRLTQDEVPSW